MQLKFYMLCVVVFSFASGAFFMVHAFSSVKDTQLLIAAWMTLTAAILIALGILRGKT